MSTDSPSSSDGGRLLVTLVKAGRTKIAYPADVIRDDGTRITVRAPWAAPGPRDFGFVRFEPGDVFIEHFWRDRWFAVKEVRTGGMVRGGIVRCRLLGGDDTPGRWVVHLN